MAQHTVTNLIDDLDGKAADRTIRLGWEGNAYEIDLSDKNAEALERMLSKYLAAARKVAIQRSRSARPVAPPVGDKAYLGAVRVWAAENGLSIATRGRIAANILEAYEAQR
jgi:hypothetical protein